MTTFAETICWLNGLIAAARKICKSKVAVRPEYTIGSHAVVGPSATGLGVKQGPIPRVPKTGRSSGHPVRRILAIKIGRGEGKNIQEAGSISAVAYSAGL